MPRKTRGPGAGSAGAEAASMRPRPDAAENGLRPPGGSSARAASMRPRPDAAENLSLQAATRIRVRPACFNEAAARCRGKRRLAAAGGAGRNASMRPRPDAAENAKVLTDVATRVGDASMRPRPDAAENQPPPRPP